jgi:hypothetical protein
MVKEAMGEIAGGQELLVNRTGIMLNPELGAELVQSARETVPSSEGDSEEMEAERAEYAQEGLPIGSYPSPVNGSALERSEDSPGDRMAILLDKLGERLAFERQGTRLYEAFIQKMEAMPIADSEGPSADDLRHICEEELEHFKLLQQAIVELGGDATVQTPSADVAGVLAHGAMQIMSDPRTTIAQALQAALTAELADNDGWKMLQDLSEQLGYTDLAEQCAKAYEEEQEHLENVRAWLSKMVLSEAAAGDGVRAGAEDEEEEKKGESHKRSRRGNRKKSGSNKRRKK